MSILKVNTIQKKDGTQFPLIGQVVQGTDQTATTISASGGTFYSAGASASITPTSTSSKILVTVSLSAVQNTNGNSIVKLVRTAPSSVDLLSNTGGSNINGTFGGVFFSDTNYIHCLNFSYLDSPATTSLCTYTAKVGCSGAITFYVNRSVNATVNGAYERGVSYVYIEELNGNDVNENEIQSGITEYTF